MGTLVSLSPSVHKYCSYVILDLCGGRHDLCCVMYVGLKAHLLTDLLVGLEVSYAVEGQF